MSKPKGSFARVIMLILFILIATNINAQSFNQNSLNFNGQTGVGTVTSLMFGPDGRLYVAEYPGLIRILTIERDVNGTYNVLATETLTDVQTIPNHDDDGTPCTNPSNPGSCSLRETVGLTVTGTADNPVIYVNSSDFRIGGGVGGGNGDLNLDTNSGVITRLSWNGTSWDAVDIVRGLPRSEENHANNGLEFTTIGGTDYLILAQGGNTNSGAPSVNFTYLCETALSGAVLSVNLDMLEAMPILNDGRDFIYDIPTVDDPTRGNANGINDPDDPLYDGIDVNDPWGGNDALNQAKLIDGGPVQIFSPGYRNAYDLVVTESGAVYVTDNGANQGWGGFPENEGLTSVTNNYDPTEPGSSSLSEGEQIDNVDHLELVTTDIQNYTFGSFYGGHPNPIRANPSGAGLFTAPANLGLSGSVFRTQTYDPNGSVQGSITDASQALPPDWPPVPASLVNTVESDWRSPSQDNPDGPNDDPVLIWGTNTNGIDEYTASNFGGAMQGDLIAGVNTGRLRRVQLNADGSVETFTSQFAAGLGGNALGITCNGDNDPFAGTIWVGTLNGNIIVLEPQDFTDCPLPGEPSYDAQADNDSDGYTNQDEIDNNTDICSGASRPDDFDREAGGVLLSDLNDFDDDADGILDSEDPFQIGNPITSGSDAFQIPVENSLFSDTTLGGFQGLGMTGLMNNGDTNNNWLDWLDRRDDPADPNPNDILGGAIGAMTMQMTAGTALGTSNNQEKGFQYGVQVDANTGVFTVSGSLGNFNQPLQLYGNSAAPNGELGVTIGDGTQSNYIRLVLTPSGIIAQQEINDIPQTPLTRAFSITDRPNQSIVFYFVIDSSTGIIDLQYALDQDPRISIGTITAEGTILNAIQESTTDLAVGLIGTSNAQGVEVEGTWDALNVNIEDQPESEFGEPIFRINTGGILVAATDNNVDWRANAAAGSFQGDGYSVNTGALFASPSADSGAVLFENRHSSVPDYVDETTYNSIFSTERFDFNSGPEMEFSIPIADGSYIVNLYMASAFNGASEVGNRVFGINIEGNNVRDNIDLVAEFGHLSGGVLSFPVELLDGELNITFLHTLIENPLVNAIEVTTIPDQNPSNEAPVAIASATPLAGEAPLEVSFTGSGSTDDNGTITFEWDFGDGSSSNEADPLHTYTAAGTYAVFFTVTDAEGLQDITTLSIEVASPVPANTPPVALATATPLNGDAPLEVIFTGSESTDDQAITSYEWDFADGTTATEADPIHIFTNPGSYEVVLTVTDGDGEQDTSTITITASQPAENPSTSVEPIFRINAGGALVAPTDNNVQWRANATAGSLQGDGYTVNTGTLFSSPSADSGAILFENRHSSVPAYIDETIYNSIFSTERFDFTVLPEMEFTIPLATGSYIVNLYMASAFNGASEIGNRVFGIAIEGTTVRDNVDLVAEFGHLSGGVLSFPVELLDGELNITFLHTLVENPLVNAIEVSSVSESTTPFAINGIANQNNVEGDEVAIAVSSTGGNEDTIAYEISGQPSGITIDSDTGLIQGTVDIGTSFGGPNGDGVYEVQITANDGINDSASVSFSWSITTSLAWQDIDENENYTARHETSFVQAGDKFYLLGGRENAETVEEYDFGTDTWTAFANSAPFEFNHFQAVEHQGLIWVIGAFMSNSFPNEIPSDHIWIFNPSVNEWTQGPEIPAARRRGSAGLVVDQGVFYIVGGSTNGHNESSVAWLDSYDPTTGEWNILPDAPQARDHFQAAIINGNLYAAGGRLTGGADGFFAPTIPEVDVYNLASGTWSTLPSNQNIPTPRGGASAVNYNNKLVVIGGEVENQEVYGTVVTDALAITEEYDPLTQTWTRLPDMNYDRHGTQAIVSGDAIFTIGGSPNIGGGNQRNLESLGGTSPQGTALVFEELSGPETLTIPSTFPNLENPTTIEITVSGTVGIFVDEIQISGPDAEFFEFAPQQPELFPNGTADILLDSGSTSTFIVELTQDAGTVERNATLIFSYGTNSSLEIALVVPFENQTPVALAEASVTSGHAPLSVDFTGDNSTDDVGVESYLWNFDDGSTSTEVNPTHIFTTEGIFDVNLTVTDVEGLTDSNTVQITVTTAVVNQAPISVVSASVTSGDAPLSVDFTGENSTDDVGVESYVWNFDDGTTSIEVNPTHIFNTEGIFDATLTVTDTEGLSDTSSIEIIVTEPVNVPTIGVVGFTFIDALSDTELIELIDGMELLASDINDGLGLNIRGDAEPSSVGSVFLSLQGPLANTRTEGVAPYALFGDASGDYAPANFPVGTYTLSGTAFNGSSQSGGVLGETLTISFSIVETLTNTNEAPVALAEASVTAGDAPLSVDFTGENSTDDVGVESYLWNFDDGSTSTEVNPTYIFTTEGIFDVSLTVTDAEGLTDTNTVQITVNTAVVNQAPVALAEASVTSGDAPLSVDFTGDNSTDDVGVESYLWNFDDGTTSTEANPTHIFTTEGIFDVSLTVTDVEGLTDTNTVQITGNTAVVNQAPISVVAASVTSGDAPLSVDFTGDNSTDDLGVESYLWNFDDGSTSTEVNPTHIFTAEGIFDATLTVTDTEGLSDTSSIEITVTEPVNVPTIGVVGFTLIDALSDTELIELVDGMELLASDINDGLGLNIRGDAEPSSVGSVFLSLQGPLVNTRTEGVAPYALFGDASGDYAPANFPVGTYTLSGTAFNGSSQSGGVLGETLTISFSIVETLTNTNEAPVALAEVSVTSGDAPLSVDFAGDNSTDDVGVESYEWNFDDGTTSTEVNPTHIFTTEGIFDVSLTVTDVEGLTDTNTVQITVTTAVVNQAPISVVAASVTSGDAPVSVDFIGENSTDDVGVESYLWNFDDGTTSTEVNPTHIFIEEGIYDVTLTVTDAEGLTGTNTIQITVTVENLAPVALAEASVISGDIPLSVDFTGDNSTDDVGVESYFWNFDDGTTSTEINPTHTFIEEGIYNVTLTVTDEEGLTGINTIQITVTAENLAPVALAEASIISGDLPLLVDFTGENSTDDVGVESYFWNFDDGTTSTEMNPTHIFTTEGIFDVSLTVSDVEGLTDTNTVQITVTVENLAPVALAEASIIFGDIPLSVDFTGENSTDDVGVESYFWNFDDGTTSTVVNPTHIFTEEGIFDVSLTVTDIEGLTDTSIVQITATIRVNEAPIVTSPGTQTNTEGDSVALQIQATDDSSGLTYTATGLPPGLSIDPATGLISGIILETQTTGGRTVFQEENGILVVEAEAVELESLWSISTSGGEIGIEAGRNRFGNQTGGTLSYDIEITNPGVYRFQWNSLFQGSNPTDENDSWLRLPNTDDVWFFGIDVSSGNPGSEADIVSLLESSSTSDLVFPRGSGREGGGFTAVLDANERVIDDDLGTIPIGSSSNGYFKTYRSGGQSQVYDWQARTSDFDAHNIYVWFVNPGIYTLDISERSLGHTIDRFAMYRVDGPNFSDFQLSNLPISSIDSSIDGAAAGSPYNVEITVADNESPSLSSTIQFTWIVNPVSGGNASTDINSLESLSFYQPISSPIAPLEISPNPSSQEAFIKLADSSDFSIHGMQLFSSSGRLVKTYSAAEIEVITSNLCRLNLETFVSGVYYLRASVNANNQNEILNSKIVVSK